ncbi:MAG: hypothetical protein OEQ13_03665 [Acidobacteriota bacterium]|nr:hypothetical protein [Acidobacteriota bacterium]
MRILPIVVALAAAVSIPAQAGLFKDSVDLADLAQLSSEGLESLKDTEFAAFVARVKLEAAKAREDQAQGALKAAKRTISVEELDMKAATAEAKAAKANQDEDRLAAAEVLGRDAKTDLEVARLFEAWKKDDRASTRAAVKHAEAQLDLAEARRDHARVERLFAEKAAAASKYDSAEYAKRVSKRQGEADKTSRSAEKTAAKAAKSKAAFEAAAKQQVRLVPEPAGAR